MKKGIISTRFKIKEHHELATVTNAFNTMADQLVYNINQLTEQENVRKDFIAHISHDLRTPLAIARGYTETLLIKRKEGIITEIEWDEYTNVLLNKILQVEQMITRLFELSKIESVAFQLNKEPFVLSEIVQETVNNFQLTAKENQVSLQCTQCQYHVWVNADINMMERVVQNLIENAIKNTPANGSIQVSMNLTDDNLSCIISNSGALLPDGLLTWINSSEKQKGGYDTRPSKSGLGLMIVKRILLLHKTSLKASTLNNSQNIFSFSLPIDKPEQ